MNNKLKDAKIDWAIVAGTIMFQVGSLSALFFFTWQAFLVFLILYVMSGMGVTLGYHRLLTHSSFNTYRPIRWLIATIGALSGEGPAVWWVATHRKHHAFSDKDGDPHSPKDGFLWSHMLWFLPKTVYQQETINHYAPDLWEDTFLRWQFYLYIPIIFASAGLLYLFGWLLDGWYMGCSFVAWGFLFRTVFVEHATWFVNSASHVWGYKNYITNDESRNLWWVAALTFGEGWHNNHHAFPRMAAHGHKWWEIDLTYWAICFMEKIGLAWDVVKYKTKKAA